VEGQGERICVYFKFVSSSLFFDGEACLISSSKRMTDHTSTIHIILGPR
jgi:predicted naringenin-chalcone synthase